MIYLPSKQVVGRYLYDQLTLRYSFSVGYNPTNLRTWQSSSRLVMSLIQSFDNSSCSIWGISKFFFPSSRLPVFFLFVPPHCLKKKATSIFSHCCFISKTHSFFMGLGFLPLSPPTITQSIFFKLSFGKG